MISISRNHKGTFHDKVSLNWMNKVSFITSGQKTSRRPVRRRKIGFDLTEGPESRDFFMSSVVSK